MYGGLNAGHCFIDTTESMFPRGPLHMYSLPQSPLRVRSPHGRT